MTKSNRHSILYFLSVLIIAFVISCSNKQDSKRKSNNLVMDENEFWNIISMFNWKYEG